MALASGADPEALGRIPGGVPDEQGDRGGHGARPDACRRSPDSVLCLAQYWMKTHYGPFSELLHTARTGDIAAVKYLGKPFFEWISESPRLAEIQNAAMVDGGRSARGDLLAAYKLPGSGTVADIGGADGTLLARRPQVHPRHRDRLPARDRARHPGRGDGYGCRVRRRGRCGQGRRPARPGHRTVDTWLVT